MRNIKLTRITVVAIILLAGSAYISFRIWSTSIAQPQVFKIGVISPSSSQYDSVKTIISLAEEDVNSYYRGQGRDVTITLEVANAEGSGEGHLNIVKDFKSQGINVVIGGAWSSQVRASLPYANENGVLLVSPSSTATDLSIPGDNLFRLCPDDAVQSRVVSKALQSWGAEAIVIIQLDDDWAKSISDALSQGFTESGGIVAASIRYDIAAANFTGCLDTADKASQEAVAQFGSDHVIVVALGFHEIARLAIEARGYPTVYGLKWFGSDGTAHNAALMVDAPEEASHLRLYSPLASPLESQGIQTLRERYASASGESLGSRQAEFQAANWYDAVWICAKAIIEAGTTDAAELKEALPRAADNEYTTGLCRLNSAGDRVTADYIIWGYALTDDTCESVRYGLYEGAKGEVAWDTEALGFSPPGQR